MTTERSIRRRKEMQARRAMKRYGKLEGQYGDLLMSPAAQMASVQMGVLHAAHRAGKLSQAELDRHVSDVANAAGIPRECIPALMGQHEALFEMLAVLSPRE